MCLQDAAHVGFNSMIDSIMTMAESHLERLNRRRRETCPASDLVVGVQCGGSDAFSATANPAVGFAADLLVRAGATIMFSEVTEVRDGVAQLTSRAATEDVAREIIREMDWYDRYLQRGRVDRSAHDARQQEGWPVEHRREGDGADREVGQRADRRRRASRRSREAEGAAVRGDTRERFHLRHAAARGRDEPAYFHDRPRPYGLAQVPVIKVATRSDLARRWHDLMDLDAGQIATGAATIEDTGWALFRLMLDVASGKRRTWAEQWKLANALTLFNPAPVT